MIGLSFDAAFRIAVLGTAWLGGNRMASLCTFGHELRDRTARVALDFSGTGALVVDYQNRGR